MRMSGHAGGIATNLYPRRRRSQSYSERMKKTQSSSNVVDDPKLTLQDFSIADLAQYTKEGAYSPDASGNFHLFYVGRDDVHDILKHLLSRVSTSLYLSMFGYDDDELNDIIMQKVMDPTITVVISLDKSQAGGVHEKKLIALDQKTNLLQFNTHFAIGQSSTHQILHTKGAVLDGIVGFEGSTNWSDSGEGTFVTKGAAGGVGYKAQSNTLAVFTDPDARRTFTANLINEHLIVKSQMVAK